MRRPYPTTKRGLIIPPYELGYTVPTERQNIHHGYWPWGRLNEHFVSRTFGSLITNTFPMIPEEHNIGRLALHHDFSPPKLPSYITMIDIVEEYLDANGQIDCIKHKSTSEHYIVTAEEWQRGAHGLHTIHSAGNSTPY